jgi:hypothetical protein
MCDQVGEYKANMAKWDGGQEARMSTPDHLDVAMEKLFAVDEGLPCPAGTGLLRNFAEARPADFAFLKPGDLIDLNNSAFEGIPEWDAFAEHYAECELCNE